MTGIISRAEWGSTGVRGGSQLAGPLLNVIIHTWAMANTADTGRVESARLMRAVQASHRNSRGFSDFGYSFAVDTAGRIFEGRGWLRSGAHTVGANRVGHGIGMFGHGDVQPLTDAQWRSARELIAEGVRLGHIAEDYAVSGHRDWGAPKTCPGNLVYPHLEKLHGVTLEGDNPVGTPILRPDTISGARLLAWAEDHDATEWFIRYVHAVHTVDVAGVDRAIMVAQAAHETRFGRFGGHVDPAWFNPAGIKSKAGHELDENDPAAWAHFVSPEEGAQAQAHHLALYAGAPGTPFAATPDPRHSSWSKGKAATVEQLSGTWATDLAYHEFILGYLNEMAATPEPTPEPEPEPPVVSAELAELHRLVKALIGETGDQMTRLAAYDAKIEKMRSQ